MIIMPTKIVLAVEKMVDAAKAVYDAKQNPDSDAAYLERLYNYLSCRTKVCSLKDAFSFFKNSDCECDNPNKDACNHCRAMHYLYYDEYGIAVNPPDTEVPEKFSDFLIARYGDEKAKQLIKELYNVSI